jgi:hypothetical protein
VGFRASAWASAARSGRGSCGVRRSRRRDGYADSRLRRRISLNFPATWPPALHAVGRASCSATHSDICDDAPTFSECGGTRPDSPWRFFSIEPPSVWRKSRTRRCASSARRKARVRHSTKGRGRRPGQCSRLRSQKRTKSSGICEVPAIGVTDVPSLRPAGPSDLGALHSPRESLSRFGASHV